MLAAVARVAPRRETRVRNCILKVKVVLGCWVLFWKFERWCVELDTGGCLRLCDGLCGGIYNHEGVGVLSESASRDSTVSLPRTTLSVVSRGENDTSAFKFSCSVRWRELKSG